MLKEKKDCHQEVEIYDINVNKILEMDSEEEKNQLQTLRRQHGYYTWEQNRKPLKWWNWAKGCAQRLI